MRLIDTNIVIYALGRPHPLRQSCREILEAVAHGEVEANIDTEVLQELLYVYSARDERGKALKMVEDMLILFPNPYGIQREELVRAKDLMKKYHSLVPRDAIHCAVVINYGLEGIISTDRDLKTVKEIECFHP